METLAMTETRAEPTHFFERQRAHQPYLKAESAGQRKARLRKLEAWIHANRERIRKEVHADFGKPLIEVDTSEIYPVLIEIRHVLAELDEWVKPRKVDAPFTYIGTRSEIRYEPKGVCLILAPWNFPFNLCVGPLVSCLAAGNSAFIKPSEHTPHTSGLIRTMVAELFPAEEVVVVEGGAEASQSLLELPFDHIFFTGSPAIGKLIMKAAAVHLASVTLELGGKSPVIIDRKANLQDAARRIAFGKFFNNGQTCIAPDYVFIHEEVRDRFIEKLKNEIARQFGRGSAVTSAAPDYARIVNERHFQRLSEMLEEAIRKGARAVLTGRNEMASNFFSPVVLTDVPTDARVLEEEIFGPILPVLTFRHADEPVAWINARPKPLALYVFGSDRTFTEHIISKTSAGTVCVNECVLQFTHPNLPFGGVNNSGIGKSHGYYGFLAFSNEKPVLKQKSGWSAPYLLYPPYTTGMKKVVDALLKWF